MKTPGALRTLASILLSLGLLHAQQDPGLGLSTRLYDVRDIVRIEADFLPATVLEASFLPSASETGDDPRPAIEIGDLTMLVQQATAPTYWESEGTEIRTEETGFLCVTCSEEMHAKARNVLGQLRRFLFEPVLVEVHELPGAALDGGKAVLSAAEADALLSKAGAHRVFAGRTSPRKPLLLESKRTQNRFAGLDMKVAQGAAAPDLVLATDSYGPSWIVQAMRTVDERIMVSVSGSDRALVADAPTGELPTGTAGKVTVQLPATRIATIHASAYLSQGQALLVGNDAPDGTVLCIRAQRSSPGANDGTIGELTAYEVRHLVRGSAHATALRVPYQEGPLFPEENGEPYPAVFDEGRLMEWLMARVAPDTWDGDPNVMMFVDGHLLVDADEATRKAVAAELRTLQELDARQFSLELRFGELPAGANRTFLTANVDQLADALPKRCLSTVSASREVRMSATRHTPYVKDYDVVIAQSSAATTPELGSYARGFLARGKAIPMDRGTLLLDLHLTILDHDPAPSEFSLTDPRFAHVGKVDVRENKVRGATVVALDQWTILHLAPVAGGQAHIAVVARVRAL